MRIQNNSFFVAWWANDKWGEVSDVFEGYPLAWHWLRYKQNTNPVQKYKIRGFLTRPEAEQYQKYGDNIR